ncbi:SEC14-like protein 5, partial [Armadillidium nasatum]
IFYFISSPLYIQAYVRRFPTCDMIPIMAGADILTEETSEDGSVEVTSRKCKLNVEAPYLLKKIMGVEFVYFIQTNTLDKRNRTLHINAKNESFVSRVVINENCKYFVHPENSDWTCFEQSASLDVKSFFGFESAVEKVAMKQYSINISKGKEIIEHFINELKEDGITHIPIWHRPKKTSVKKRLSKAELSSNTLTASSEPEEENSHSGSEDSAVFENLHLGASAASQNRKEDTFSKLDSDYIKRCLGDLSPLQESRLVQLKKWVAELQKGKVPSDTTLLRFLRARDFNLEKAREMLSQSLIWRKKNQVDKIMAEYQVPKVIKEYFPGGWHYHDKEGHPLYLLRLGQMDVKGLIKSIGEEGLLRHIVENNYPETMSHVLIIRAPRVFPILWTLVSSFIDENTRTKFLFYGGNDYQCSGSLIDFMDKEYIPDFLGGVCKSSVGEGGLVPKTLYMPGEEMDVARQLSLSDQSSLSFGVAVEGSGALGVIDAVIGGDDVHKSVIEKGWKEGVDYFRVEPQLVCHDGESVQWKYYEAPHSMQHNSALDLIDSITSHKAKVMYCYETLRSADYKLVNMYSYFIHIWELFFSTVPKCITCKQCGPAFFRFGFGSNIDIHKFCLYSDIVL